MEEIIFSHWKISLTSDSIIELDVFSPDNSTHGKWRKIILPRTVIKAIKELEEFTVFEMSWKMIINLLSSCAKEVRGQ